VLQIVRHTVVDDVGKMVNPLLVKGQIHGGVVQGLGQALFENLVYDDTTAQLLAGSFMDYAMPRADDVPFFEVDSHEVVDAGQPAGRQGRGRGRHRRRLPALVKRGERRARPAGRASTSTCR
jgi:carbon-monoxide dehydrogenase large subunit